MALKDPRTVFGIHSVSFYNRTSGEFSGIVKVLENSSINISSELIPLMGGSQKFPWAVESGPSTAEIALSLSQYDDFLIELAYGKAPTANAAEAGGSITSLVAGTGALVEATTGLAGINIEAGEEAELKFGRYVVKAVSATEVDVFVSSDVDFGRGTDGEYENDLLKITASPLTVGDASATTSVAGYGLELVGGSGTVALTVGDTVTFEAKPINSESMDVVIGGATDVVPEVGMVLYAQQRGNDELFEITVYKAKLTGLPFGFTKSEWATAEITAQAYYDSSKDGVLAIRSIKPV